MKQFLLGISLFVAVVAASYLKVTYSSQERRQEVAAIQEQLSADSLRALVSIDSLNRLLKESWLSLDEFQAEKEKSEGRVADSLGRIVENQNSRISRLKRELQSARQKIKTRRPKTKTNKAAKSSPDSRAIAKFYRARVEKLPSDLSDYERRIMIDEIREKTITRFSITKAQFDKIRKEQKLDF